MHILMMGGNLLVTAVDSISDLTGDVLTCTQWLLCTLLGRTSVSHVQDMKRQFKRIDCDIG